MDIKREEDRTYVPPVERCLKRGRENWKWVLSWLRLKKEHSLTASPAVVRKPTA